MNKSQKNCFTTLSKLLKDKDLVIFDTETTGISVDKDEIIQFAGIRIGRDGSHEIFEFVCNPSVPIHEKASEVNGYTKESLEHLPSFKKFVPKLVEFFKNTNVAGFNLARFDVKLLDRQMKENGVEDIFKDSIVYDAYPIYCNHSSRKLEDAFRYYTNKEIKDAHDALGDVLSTAAVIVKQLEKEGSTLEEVASKFTKVETNGVEKFIIYDENNNPILNFSKNKGKKLADVDEGFVRWMLSQSFVPQEVKTIVKEFKKSATPCQA